MEERFRSTLSVEKATPSENFDPCSPYGEQHCPPGFRLLAQMLIEEGMTAHEANLFLTAVRVADEIAPKLVEDLNLAGG